MKKAIGIIILGLLLSTNAYAFLIKIGKEGLPIITVPPGAQCELKNNKGTWSVVTPGEVIVKRSKQPLKITCVKDGYKKFTRSYHLKDPKTKLSEDAIGYSSDMIYSVGTGDYLWAVLYTVDKLTLNYGTYATHKKNSKGFIYIKLFTGIDPDFNEDDK